MSRTRHTVLLAASAEHDLDEIADWYLERHPGGLERFVQSFVDARDMLATFPRSGRERPDLRPGVRSLPVHPFLVFYRVDAATKTVTIVRILHGHMDIDDRDVIE